MSIEWDLVRAGRPREALPLFEEECANEASAFTFYNLGKARLLADECAGALAAIDQAIALTAPRYYAGRHFMMRGICHWYLDQPAAMIEALHLANDAPYTDAAGGVGAPVLMLYVAARLRDETLARLALKLLHKHVKRPRRGWPWPIAPYLLGQLDDARLADLARESAPLRFRHECQAYFYMAVSALRQGDETVYQGKMRDAGGDSGAFLECEYFLARWEVLRGFPDTLFSTPS
jgi:lipoprotein NlpI